jgi:predicted esterase
MNRDPHASQPAISRGPTPETADGTLILLHGRGASAESILSLYEEFKLPRLAAIAPQAAGGTWYPYSFLAPVASNQPWLDSALARVEQLVIDALDRGIPAGKIGLLGFSQGACLASEFVVRHPRSYGAVILFTGGIIGPDPPPALLAARAPDEKSLLGTPVFLGSSDPDPHVPYTRIEQTAGLLRRLGAEVDLRRYPGMPHTINREELDAAREMLEGMCRR